MKNFWVLLKKYIYFYKKWNKWALLKNFGNLLKLEKNIGFFR
jgi:hypothetical protein